MVDDSGSLIPYGLPCVRELFRFLVSLINPHDSHNQDMMVQIALSLLATALETGAEHLDKFDSLLALVKDDLARNLVSYISCSNSFPKLCRETRTIIAKTVRELQYLPCIDIIFEKIFKADFLCFCDYFVSEFISIFRLLLRLVSLEIPPMSVLVISQIGQDYSQNQIIREKMCENERLYTLLSHVKISRAW